MVFELNYYEGGAGGVGVADIGVDLEPKLRGFAQRGGGGQLANVDHPEILKQSTHISVGLGSRIRYLRCFNILKALFKFSKEL